MYAEGTAQCEDAQKECHYSGDPEIHADLSNQSHRAGPAKRCILCTMMILKTHTYLIAYGVSFISGMENTLVAGGLAEWETELVPTFEVRIWTVHTLTDVFARRISASPLRSMVTNETVLAVRNRSAELSCNHAV